MYAETGAALRAELTMLLRRHRIQVALQGADRWGTAATSDQRVQFGSTIRRYRRTVLAWCAESLETASPMAFTNLPDHRTNPFTDAPAEATAKTELRYALATTLKGSAEDPPDLDLLTTPQSNSLVEHWRQLARAAALAEHDVVGPNVAQQISTPQALALVGDVASVVQAMVVLDQRYRNTPGWQALEGAGRLGWTALACAMDVGLGQPDYRIDDQGWRPRAKTIRSEVPAGIRGVLQAEHNLLIRLRSLPNAMNLRLIVDSQRLLSHTMTSLATPVSPALGQDWEAREGVYRSLQQQLRDVGGNLGTGDLALTEGALAVTRAQHLPANTTPLPRELAAFHTLFTRIDDRLADIITEGAARTVYLQRVPVPRLDQYLEDSPEESPIDLTKVVRQPYVPISTATAPELLDLVRSRLRPGAPDTTRLLSAGESRARLQIALVEPPVGSHANREPF